MKLTQVIRYANNNNDNNNKRFLDQTSIDKTGLNNIKQFFLKQRLPDKITGCPVKFEFYINIK